jgi:hypothetical protein
MQPADAPPDEREMQRVFDYVRRCSAAYGIDASHGLTHAQDTVRWARALIDAAAHEPKDGGAVSVEDARMALYAAALHDMCDAKYRPDKAAAGAEIGAWLKAECGWDAEHASALVAICMSMPYSLLKADADANGGVPQFPDLGRWRRAYHLARHADLLDAYSVPRCVEYTATRLVPHGSAAEQADRVLEVFHRRMFRYIQDGWISLPSAVKLAHGLHAQAQAELDAIMTTHQPSGSPPPRPPPSTV